MTKAMSRIPDKPTNVKVRMPRKGNPHIHPILLFDFLLSQRSENQPSKSLAATRPPVPVVAKGRKTNEEKATKTSANEQTANESIVTNVKKPLHTSTPAEISHYPDVGNLNAVQKVERYDGCL